MVQLRQNSLNQYSLNLGYFYLAAVEIYSLADNHRHNLAVGIWKETEKLIYKKRHDNAVRAQFILGFNETLSIYKYNLEQEAY